jgi:hypothetical protein
MTLLASGNGVTSHVHGRKHPQSHAIHRGCVKTQMRDRRMVETLETIAPLSDDPIVGLPAVAA